MVPAGASLRMVDLNIGKFWNEEEFKTKTHRKNLNNVEKQEQKIKQVPVRASQEKAGQIQESLENNFSACLAPTMKSLINRDRARVQLPPLRKNILMAEPPCYVIRIPGGVGGLLSDGDSYPDWTTIILQFPYGTLID